MKLTDIAQAVVDAAAANDLLTVNTLLKRWDSTASESPSSGSLEESMLPLQQALYDALRAGHVEMARNLLRHGCKVDPDAASAARHSKNPEVYGVLIDYGWNVNDYIGYPGDALICAVGEDKLPHVEYLLTHGANPNANLRGDLYTALEIGAMFASPAVLNLLLTHGAILEHRSALNKAAYVGRLDNINLLLDKGAAINAIPDNENIPDLVGQNGIGTALHDAAEADKADVVRLLLERGADRLVKDTAGHTAREVAVKKGHDECARLLE